MQRSNKITEFMFNYAQYDVGDQNGQRVLLKINYADNSYEVESNDTVSQAYRHALKRVAQDLLERKHGVNFVDRLKIE